MSTSLDGTGKQFRLNSGLGPYGLLGGEPLRLTPNSQAPGAPTFRGPHSIHASRIFLPIFDFVLPISAGIMIISKRLLG